jgi:hypothetical protein
MPKTKNEYNIHQRDSDSQSPDVYNTKTRLFSVNITLFVLMLISYINPLKTKRICFI